MEIVHEMLTRFASSGVYNALYTYPDLQAYRTDKFEGFVRQPRGHGPGAVLQLVAELLSLKPVSESTGGAAGAATASDGGGIGGAGIAAIVVLALGARRRGGAWVVMRRRSDRRRARVSPRVLITKLLGSLATLAFVVVFNFFLFRVVEQRSGREPVPRTQPDRLAARRADARVRPRRLQARPVLELPQADREPELRPLLRHQPAGDRGDRRRRRRRRSRSSASPRCSRPCSGS